MGEQLYYLDNRIPVYADPEDIKIVKLMLKDQEPVAVVKDLQRQGYPKAQALNLVVLARKALREQS
jgi:hypothetical protein